METTLTDTDYVPELVGIPKDFTALIFGPPKSGKTSFAASAPRSLVLECEPGGCKYIRCNKKDVNSYDELRTYYKLLKEDKKFETVVIDSLDRVAQWIEEDICNRLGLTSIMDNKRSERFGSQWGLYVDNVLAFIATWQRLGKKIIFLAHTKKAELADAGIVINPKTINLYGQAANRVLALIENIGYLFAKEEADGTVKRYLSFRPGIYVEAGSRHPALTDKVIELPKENPYMAFESLFKAQDVNGSKTKKV